MIVTTVVLTNAAQAKCFHSQCRSRMYAVTHQILNLNCILSLEPNGDQWNFGKQHQQGPQNSYPISARGLEGFNTTFAKGIAQNTANFFGPAFSQALLLAQKLLTASLENGQRQLPLSTFLAGSQAGTLTSLPL